MGTSPRMKSIAETKETLLVDLLQYPTDGLLNNLILHHRNPYGPLLAVWFR
jgi:hypothetical protein